MYNGIIIADRELDVGYTAHPGTPLQYVVAIAARINFLFAGSDDLIQHFIDHPEEYITSANLLQNALLFMALFVVGWSIHRYTGSVPLALASQLIPMGNFSLVHLTGRVIPEGLMLFPFMMLFILLMKHLFRDKVTTEKELVVWGALIGFGTAIKLTFAPVLVLPLVAIKMGGVKILRTIGYTLVFFLLFAYPIVLHVEKFWAWVINISMHTGKHGAGTKAFIDLDVALSNFNSLVNFDVGFFILATLALVFAATTLLVPKANKDRMIRKSAWAIVGLSAMLVVSVLFTIKHYALHYFMPFYTVKIMLIVLSGIIVVRLLGAKRDRYRNVLEVAVFIAVAGLAIVQLQYVQRDLENRKIKSFALMATGTEIDRLINEDLPVVFTAPYYGAPFKAYAHMSGFRMSYNAKSKFQTQLRLKYPHYFEYNEWTDELESFGSFYSWQDVAEQGNGRLYLYIGPDTREKLEGITKQMERSFANYETKVLFETNNELLLLVNAVMVGG